jgi:glycerol uptake facilitator-like aquaporin
MVSQLTNRLGFWRARQRQRYDQHGRQRREMFWAGTARAGPGQWVAEFVASFGLLLTIFGCVARAPEAVACAVGLYITAAYWFTASTSFANPAVTLARSLSDTFAGIAPPGVFAFVLAQIVGALAAAALARWLWPKRENAA